MSNSPFYEVRAWSFPAQLIALTIVLVAMGMVVGRAAPENLDLEIGAVAPETAVEVQVEQLQADDPIGNDELMFSGWTRAGITVSRKGVLVASFDGPHELDELTFELWKSPRDASLRFEEYRSQARGPEFLHPPIGSWARFCRDSSGEGIECFGRVENAVIRGLVDDAQLGDPLVEKIDAGILVNVGVKHWVSIFGDTEDMS